MNSFRWIALLLFFLLTFSLIVLAHGDEEEAAPEQNDLGQFDQNVRLEESLQVFNLRFLSIVAAIVIVLVVFAMNHKHKTKKLKKAIFLAIIIPISIATLFLAGSTIYLNTTSLTEGPVHWHADYQVWYCDQQLQLVDASGLSNRVGSSTLHSHGDNRIHIEGVVRKFDDVTLQSYFRSVGGDLRKDGYAYPTQQGVVIGKNGELCQDGSQGHLKVYVNGKLNNDPEHYVIAHTSYVPPGDCIIFDFGPGDAEMTNKLCDTWNAQGWTYQNQDEMREHEGGVE